jgi:hypothetical protein
VPHILPLRAAAPDDDGYARYLQIREEARAYALPLFIDRDALIGAARVDGR